MEFALIVLAVAFLSACMPIAWSAVRVYRSLRGAWVVACPETHRAAVVEVDVWRAVARRTGHGVNLQLRMCSRWPAKQGCGQECMSQIAASPRGCKARSAARRPSRPAEAAPLAAAAGSGRRGARA